MIQMDLARLKALAGIAEGDNSQDAMLSLYLGAAIEQLQAYATKWDFKSEKEWPKAFTLGIVRYVQIAMERSKKQVKSETISGLGSKTYAVPESETEQFAEVFAYWEPYRSKGLFFQPMLRDTPPGNCGGGFFW